MNIHETIIFIHIYMSTHKHMHRHMYKYICRHTNKIAHTHITNLSILLHLHVCLGIIICPCIIYIHTNACVDIHIPILQIIIYTYIHKQRNKTYTHIHTHTHTHTHTHALDRSYGIQRCNLRFFTIFSQCCELSLTRMLKWPGRSHVQMMCNTSSTYLMPVSCYVPYGTKGQLSYRVWKSLNSLFFCVILLAEPLNRWRRGGNWSTRRKPMAVSFRKCHILKPEVSSPNRDSSPHNNIGGRLGQQTY